MIEDCPRCGDTNTEVVATSPEGDVWTMYRCDRCEFVWRDTEDREELTPHFDASDEELKAADAAPPVEYPED